ncbi:MAG: hypothetical protein AB1397_01295 [bacterium]
MRKFTILLSFLSLNLGIADLKITPSYDEESSIIKARVDFEPLKISKEGTYSIVQSDGCIYSYTPHRPRLPLKELFLLLPPNSRIKDVKIIKEQEFIGEYDVVEVEEPIPIGEDRMQDTGDEEWSLFPENVAFIGEIQGCRGYSLLAINVFAGQCKEKALYWNKSINIEIILEKPKILSTPEFFRGDDEDRAFIESLVENKEIIQKYKPLKKKSSPYNLPICNHY